MKRRAVIPVAALVLAACSDKPSPTAPPTTAAAPAPSLSVAGSMNAGALDFSTDLKDLQTRVLPGFPDAEVAARLGGYLDELHSVLMAGDTEEAARVLALAREIAQPGATNWGDLGNINLVLNTIGRALGEE